MILLKNLYDTTSLDNLEKLLANGWQRKCNLFFKGNTLEYMGHYKQRHNIEIKYFTPDRSSQTSSDKNIYFIQNLSLTHITCLCILLTIVVSF